MRHLYFFKTKFLTNESSHLNLLLTFYYVHNRNKLAFKGQHFIFSITMSFGP